MFVDKTLVCDHSNESYQAVLFYVAFKVPGMGGGGGTPYSGLYGEAPPKRGTFFRLQV